MNLRLFAIPFVLFIIVSSCVPINSCFESARMLEKNQVEVRANYSAYIYNENSESDPSNYNYGGGLGYGISDKLNIKMRYELITFPDNSEDLYHYIDIAPKYSIIQNKLAVTMPIGVYTADGNDPTFVLSPRAIVTYPFNDHVEATATAKADFFLEEDEDIPIGFTLGFGLSKNLNAWALRPETGFMFDPGDPGTSFTFGIGFNYNFRIK